MPLPATPSEALRFLEGLSPSVIRLGLERVEEALERLGHPEQTYTSLQVAGTNGKGSTCAIIAACLRAHGLRVGLYTSPHLVRIHERFLVDGREPDDDLLGCRILEVLHRLPQVARRPSPLTYFELGTLVALWHFAQERVDVAVLEVGLGGRLDATTAVRPSVSAITPVSFDHTDILGKTLEAIALEKAGVCKEGVPLVVSRQAPEALDAITRIAYASGAVLRLEGTAFELAPDDSAGAEAASRTFRGNRLVVGGLRLGRLRGAHQWRNAAVAFASLEAWSERTGHPLDEVHLRQGLLDAHWPGRLEELPGTPTLLLDGAHNPAGAEVLAAALRELYPGRTVHLVYGVLADKDHLPVLRTLLPLCRSASLAPVKSPRSLSPSAYEEKVRELCPDVRSHGSVEEAMQDARSRAAPGDLVLCTGSLLVVGEVKAALEPATPRA